MPSPGADGVHLGLGYSSSSLLGHCGPPSDPAKCAVLCSLCRSLVWVLCSVYCVGYSVRVFGVQCTVCKMHCQVVRWRPSVCSSCICSCSRRRSKSRGQHRVLPDSRVSPGDESEVHQRPHRNISFQDTFL